MEEMGGMDDPVPARRRAGGPERPRLAPRGTRWPKGMHFRMRIHSLGQVRPSFLQGFKSRGHSAADTAADATAGLIRAGARWGHHAPACAEAEAQCPWRRAKGPSSARRKGGEGPGRHPGRDPAGSSPRSKGSASQREWPECAQGQRPGGMPGRRLPPAAGRLAWPGPCNTSTWAPREAGR